MNLSDFKEVTILILVDGFLQLLSGNEAIINEFVTILILVDGFLQYNIYVCLQIHNGCHNPYFSRWFSAIYIKRKLKSIWSTSQSLF